MISTYQAQPTVTEADARRINLDGLFQRMLETGHCPLRDYDVVNLAGTYGIGTGTMIPLIRRNALDARLEDEHMGRKASFDWDKAKELYEQGMNDFAISLELDCAVSSVIRWREKNGLLSKKAKAKAADTAPQRTESEQAAMKEMAAKLAEAGAEQLIVEPAFEAAAAEMDLVALARKPMTVAEMDAELLKLAIAAKPICTHPAEFSSCGDCPGFPCELTPEVKRKPATVNQEFERAVVDMMDQSHRIARLERERLILIGIAIGAGRYDSGLIAEALR